MSSATLDPENDSNQKWYQGISGYQWLILLIASAGWIFDIYEGQIFNITRGEMLKDLLGAEATDGNIKKYGDIFLGVFLLGGTVGGLLFGSLADKYGRRPIMVATILMYSLFSGLTYFAQSPEQVAVLRFLVAMGVGGEWAVAASLVAEIFPKRARAQASSIFHASSVLGTWLATLAGIMVGVNWRYAYLLGVIPALLIVAVRVYVKEPERWQSKAAVRGDAGSFKSLFSNWLLTKRALLGMLLAAVGLGTFWAGLVATQNLVTEHLIGTGMDSELASQKGKFAYGIVQTVGSGIGLVLFGPISNRFGRKPTFVFFHLAAFVMVMVVCLLQWDYTGYLLILPIFGFFALGIHAGYAVYFPELFPTHLRSTGSSFCFNGGRLLAASMLFVAGPLKDALPLNQAMAWLGCIFLVGAAVILFLPETRHQDLMDDELLAE
ncbi:MAG: MFS transporter [Pirellulaceae bacterium]|nr:MFS transporter [Pirellulaceae bacterium]